MSLRTDQRGQAIQVGAVLLFAVLIVAFSSYQAVIIPEDNRRVEFNHNQEVQEHLGELRSAVLGAADSRSVRSVTVALGTTYPSRTLGLNPGPPGGSLRTVGTGDPMVNLTIENATADGETGDFWNGTEQVYDTGAISYEPIYNRYDEAPTTVYEHSVLYNRFPSSNALVLANQSLLDGDRLSITTVDGSLDRTSSRSTSVDVRPISSGGEGVLLEEQDSSSPIVLEFDSQLSASRWERILSDQDNVAAVSETSTSVDGEFDRIRVELASGVDYHLGMTKAAVGQGATGEGPAYLTDVAGDGATVQRGSSHDLTLAVRDPYNNPVAGVSVAGSVDGSDSGSLDENRKTTGTDGRVSFTYRTTSSTSDGDQAINFTMEDASRLSGSSFDARTPANVSMEVTVSRSGGGGGGGTYDVAWTDPSSEDSNSGDSFGSCDADSCLWDVGASPDNELDLNATLAPIFEGVELDFAVSNSTVGTISPTSVTTDSNGAAMTTLTANENGTVNVLASGNEGSDVIEIVIENARSGGRSGEVVAYPDEFDDIDYNYPDPETGENNSIPPSGDGRGELTNGFTNMQNPDDGDATSGVHSRDGQLAIGVATRNISETGSEYTLEIRHNHPSYRSAVTVEIVDPSTGQTIQSRPLAYTSNNGFVTESIALNSQAEQYVSNGGALYVVYTGGNDAYADIDYQRVEVD